MTNLKTIFKQKSKLLLIVLSLLGMIFSYSCSCRSDRITGGGGDGNGNGGTGNGLTGGKQNAEGGMDYDPEATLSRTTMVVNADGNAVTYPITVTLVNADVSSWTVSGDLTKDDFDFTKGILKVKTDKLSTITTKKSAKLNITYKIKSGAGENDKLTKDSSGDLAFEVIKAQKKTLNDFKSILTSDIGAFSYNDVSIKFYEASADGNGFVINTSGKDNNDASNYETQKIGKQLFGSDKLLVQLKKGVTGSAKAYLTDITYSRLLPNGDNVVFYYNLDINDAYEFPIKEIGIEIKNSKHATGNNLAIEWTE